MRIIYVVLLWVSVIGITYADEWQGFVIGIADGDTLTALNPSKHQIKIRLAEVDAPESSESFGTKSKQSLAQLCYKKAAVIRETGKDRYGRAIARVYCDGVDANAEQVRRGMAWAFQKYLTDPGIDTLEKAARAGRVGLWSDNAPVAPWDYRAAKRAQHALSPQSNPMPRQYPTSESFSCEGKNSTCKSMHSCAEAMFYLKQCGASKLDRDNDGRPCEALCK